MDLDSNDRTPLADIRARIASHWDTLAPAEREVAAMLIGTEPSAILYESASKLGARTGTSGATVVRTAQALGYRGLAELKATIVHEENKSSSPTARLQNRVKELGESVNDLLDAQAHEITVMFDQLQEMTKREGLSDVAGMLARAHQVHCYGIGMMSVLASLLVTRLTRLGVLSREIVGDGFSAADALLQIRPDDVLVVFAPSRRTRQMVTMFDETRRVGAKSILITSDLSDDRLPADEFVFAPIGSRGIVSETTGASWIVDLLVHLTSAHGESEALSTRNRLTSLRTKLGYTSSVDDRARP